MNEQQNPTPQVTEQNLVTNLNEQQVTPATSDTGDVLDTLMHPGSPAMQTAIQTPVDQGDPNATLPPAPAAPQDQTVLPDERTPHNSY